jgi:LuxR family maltose regulon positive regulatory protein
LLFALEGAPMAALLTRLRQHLARTPSAGRLAHLDRLLTATGNQLRPAPDSTTPSHLQAIPAVDLLPDALTERELEVLTLMAAGQGNAEIARSLYVAPSTVKTHVNHVFGKLGVATRAQAIARARDLGLT